MEKVISSVKKIILQKKPLILLQLLPKMTSFVSFQ